jgi:hypothetical protein
MARRERLHGTCGRLNHPPRDDCRRIPDPHRPSRRSSSSACTAEAFPVCPCLLGVLVYRTNHTRVRPIAGLTDTTGGSQMPARPVFLVRAPCSACGGQFTHDRDIDDHHASTSAHPAAYPARVVHPGRYVTRGAGSRRPPSVTRASGGHGVGRRQRLQSALLPHGARRVALEPPSSPSGHLGSWGHAKCPA